MHERRPSTPRTTRHTPDCNGAEEFLLSAKDYNRRTTAERFTYVRCKQCGLIRISEIPENLGAYYKEDYYEFPSLAKLADISAKDRYRIEIVQRYSSGMRLLEVGPAYGLFSYQAFQAGFQVEAIEMDARCCDFLKGQLSIQAYRSDEPEKIISEMSKHDVIALWHVIEHLPNPWSLLATAAANLDAGGILVLAAPNPDAWQFKIMGRLWPHLDSPRHLYLLPSGLIVRKMSSLGFDCVYQSTSDTEAQRWNRFGWQRLFMNMFESQGGQYLGYSAGYLISAILRTFEIRAMAGSSYTLVCRKRG